MCRRSTDYLRVRPTGNCCGQPIEGNTTRRFFAAAEVGTVDDHPCATGNQTTTGEDVGDFWLAHIAEACFPGVDIAIVVRNDHIHRASGVHRSFADYLRVRPIDDGRGCLTKGDASCSLFIAEVKAAYRHLGSARYVPQTRTDGPYSFSGIHEHCSVISSRACCNNDIDNTFYVCWRFANYFGI